MNLFFIIFSLAGICFGGVSSSNFKYKYSAYFKIGIPDDGDQVAGLAFKAIVEVFLQNSHGIAVFKLSDVSTLSLNEDLGINEEIDFTDERFHPFEDEDLRRVVEQPFRANLRDSEPFAIEYEESEHRWLSNVRKGIALMLKNEILKGNFETQEKDSISSLFHQGHFVNNFIVEEETLFGICKAKYTINPIPETLYTGSNDLIPTRREGAANDLWRVTRSIDFDNCKDVVAIHIHAINNRRNKNKKLKVTRTSVSSYVLRGSPGHFNVYSIVTEGATTHPISLFNEHEGQSTVKQKLLLIDEGTSDVTPEFGTNLKSSPTWMYEIWSPYQAPKEGKPHPWIVYNSKNEPELGFEMFGTKKYDADQIAAAKVRILEFIKDVSQRLTDIDQVATDPSPHDISEFLMITTFYIKFLTRGDILKIFDHIFERKVGIERELVINAAASTGSNEAIEAIMDYMEEGKIKPFQLFTTFFTLPINSCGSLNISRIMDFLLSQDKPSEYLPNFAHYLSEYCIHKTSNYVPVSGVTECDDLLITKRFIPHLKDIIYNENLTWERAYAVKVLDLLRSGFTFEIVSPLIDGRMKSSVTLKILAIKSLKNWDIYAENIMRSPIIDLLTDICNDISQDKSVRMEALLVITSWEPKTKFWYDLALKTWDDPSKEFASFASSLIKVYAEGNIPTLEKPSLGATYALKFAKPPSKSYSSYVIAITKALFNNKAKISLLISNVVRDKQDENSNTVLNIFTNIQRLNQLKAEILNLYEERKIKFNKTVQRVKSDIPEAEELLNKFYNEIHYAEHPLIDKKTRGYFLSIFNEVVIPFIEEHTFQKMGQFQSPDPSKHQGGAYFNLLDESNIHPNELGLPLYTYSSLPIAISFSTKFLPPAPELIFGLQSLLRLSSVHTSEISIFLPWNHHFSTVVVSSKLELTLPIGIKKKRILGTEGPLKSSKTYFDMVYKKKFPLIRLSNTPTIMTIDSDPKAKSVLVNFEVIKKVNVTEKRINEVDPVTGIKYDLVMSADTPTSVGLRNFLPFNDISNRVWSFDFYLEPENSETTELLLTTLKGKLLTPEEYTRPGSDHYSEETGKENSQVYFYDSFEERSRKIRKFLNTSASRYVRYVAVNFDFIGKNQRRFELFNAVHSEENRLFNHVHTLQTIGFTSTGIEQQHIPKSVCFNHYIYEGLHDSDSALLKRPLKEITLEILRGCNENIFTTNVIYNISEERSVEIKEYCKANYGEENCYVENEGLLDFDYVTATVYNEDNSMAKNMVFFVENLLEIPSAKWFGDKIPRHTSQFNIRKNIQNGNWDLYLKDKSEEVFLSSFPQNIFFEYFMKYPISLERLPVDFPNGHSKCTLTTNSVETFDGVKFKTKLSNCWTLAFQSVSSPSVRYNVLLLVRKPQGNSSTPDFKYIRHDIDRVIDFSNNEIRINGSLVHKIKGDESSSFEDLHDSLIYKKGNSFLIYAAGYYKQFYIKPVIIVSSDKIEYYKEIMSIETKGICGNGDGETIPEFVGPKKCVYNDEQMFTASWTGGSENCDSATLKEYRRGVEDYQTKCEPFYGQLKESPMNHRCLYFGWKTLSSNENSYCVSAPPVTFCSNDCDIKEYKTVKMPYKCWPKEKAPEGLRTAIESKVDIITEPIHGDPYFFDYSYTETAKICKQFI